MNNDKLGWFNIEHNYNEDNDPYIEFRMKYLIKDNNSYIQWKELKPVFYK